MSCQVRLVVLLVGIWLLAGNLGVQQCAADETTDERDVEERMLEETQEAIDYAQMQEAAEELLDFDTLTFRELVEGLIKGEYAFDLQTVRDMLEDALFGRFETMRSILLQLLILGFLSALFTVLTSAFGSAQVSDIGFYAALLLLAALLLHTFSMASEVVSDTIERLLTYVKVMMPAYALLVAAAGSGTTAVVFYEFFLFLVFAVNWLVLRFLLPLVHMYVIIGIVNHISKEDMFSRFGALIRQTVTWALKTMLGIVIGFQLIQGLVSPFVDTFKSAALHKTLESIPGVGHLVNGMTEMAVGAGILIKNGVGAAMLIVILLACAAPVLTVAAYALVFQLAGVLLQPVADKRILHCLSCAKEGGMLLLRVLLLIMFLFLLAIAVLAATTNSGWG